MGVRGKCISPANPTAMFACITQKNVLRLCRVPQDVVAIFVSLRLCRMPQDVAAIFVPLRLCRVPQDVAAIFVFLRLCRVPQDVAVISFSHLARMPALRARAVLVRLRRSRPCALHGKICDFAMAAVSLRAQLCLRQPRRFALGTRPAGCRCRRRLCRLYFFGVCV